MRSMKRRELLGLAAICLGVGGAVARSDPFSVEKGDETLAGDLDRAREFLHGMIDPELDLLPEYSGANIYWLYHDNYLAAKVLKRSHSKTAERIDAAIEREGVSRSGKIELLFGELENPLPFRQHELIDVRKVGAKIIRTEVLKQEVTEGWQGYADLCLMAAIAESNLAQAMQHWTAAIKMWDGKGFDDGATKVLKRYSTYKLSLALIAGNRLKLKPPDGVKDRLRSLQAKVGGWVTDYGADGQPIGLVNVETTCLSILGLAGHVPAQ